MAMSWVGKNVRWFMREHNLREQAAAARLGVSQSGADVAQVMERAAGDDGAVPAWKREMILDAYSKPRWETPERRLQAERDFKNDTYVQCMRA